LFPAFSSSRTNSFLSISVIFTVPSPNLND
jgi:hypothetical protein